MTNKKLVVIFCSSLPRPSTYERVPGRRQKEQQEDIIEKFPDGVLRHTDFWKEGLVTYKYYPTFQEMLDAEFERLTKIAEETT